MPVNFPKGKISIIIMDIFNETAIPVIKEEAKALADELCQEVKDNIITRDIHYPPNSIKTLRNKKYKGAITTSPLIDTGAYLNSIQVRETKKGYTVGVGAGNHPTSEDTGHEPLPMRKLARMLEFGTPNMPARPHWRPTLSSFVRRKEMTKAHISKKIQEQVVKKLKVFNKERFKTK